MSQSYPWFKFSHVEYLLDPMITSLSLAAQGANTRLMAYAARQLPFGTLPNDDKTLLAMSGAKTVKQWQKLYQELIGTVWFLNNDGRLYCPLMNVESVAQSPKQDDNQQDDSKPLSNAERNANRNAERQKRYRERNANRNDVTQESVTRNADSNATVTHSNVTRNANECNESVTIGGIKGGDLDLDLKQDLDLDKKLNSHSKTREAEKKSPRFFDDELRPDVNALNAKLGANLVTEEFITQNLFAFNSHYETKCLTENQRLAKWINWFKSEEAKKQAQTIQRPKQATSKTWQSKEDERKAFNKAAMDEFVNGCSGSNIIDGEARHVI